MLFWKKLTGVLVKMGFKVNSYDSCVANRMVNSKQLTITWWVDDLKLSHVDKKVIMKTIRDLKKEFGPMRTQHGPKVTYLGMQMDFSLEQKVVFTMIDYLRAIVNKFTGKYRKWKTPAGEDLFDINDNAPLLYKQHREHFHHIIVKLLFVVKRSRPDLHTVVSFFTTRVSLAITQDWYKLSRAIGYLNSTLNLSLTLEADKAIILKWYIDALFAVHRDMKSQTGATLTMSKGSLYSTSMRQKLNTFSSTEAELVAMSYILPQTMWISYFLQDQGYKPSNCIVFQDNRSA